MDQQVAAQRRSGIAASAGATAEAARMKPEASRKRRVRSAVLVFTPVFALAFALVCFSAGCRSKNAEDASSDAQPKIVRIGYFANLTHAQAVLGVSSGDFAHAVAPAKLVPRVFNAGPSLIEALLAGEIDVGYVGPGPAINGYARSGGRLRVISGAAANGVAIVARRDSGIRTLADLKDRRIASPQLGNTQDVAARHYLIHELGQSDANNVLPISNAEQLTMMRRGQIDAAWSPEPWASRLIVQADGVLLAEEKDCWQERAFTLTVVVASTDFLARERKATDRLLEAHREWTARLSENGAAHLDELGAALRSLTGNTLPPGVLPIALERTKFTNEPLAYTLERFANWSYELGFLREKPDLSGILDSALAHTRE